MTVSLALRNQPGRVSPELRARVLQMAEELGYRVDARITEWMAHIRAAKKKDPIPLGWLNADPNDDAYHTSKDLTPYLEGAMQRCEELGYCLQEFWLRAKGMTGDRISQILHAQGIRGIIVTPTGQVGSVSLDWDMFAIASFEKALRAPFVHQATQDYYTNMMLALRILRKLDYKRIGVFLSAWSDDRSYHSCQGAVSYYHSRISKNQRVPILSQRYSLEPGKEFKPWLQKHKPDVVIAQHSQLLEWLDTAGYRIPEDISCFHMAVEDDCLDWAGIWVNKREIGAVAAEIVITQLQSQFSGIPEISRDVLIKGRWNPGWTVRGAELLSVEDSLSIDDEFS